MLKQFTLAQERRTKRDRFLIISAMLSQAIGGVCKSELMCKVGLSSAQAEIYLQVLLNSELLEVSDCRSAHAKHLFRTTDKGKSFLYAFDTLVSLLA